MTDQAAYTSREPGYPGYVNATLGDGVVVLTVRGDPGRHVQGCLAQLRVPLEAWDKLLVDMQRIRASAGPERAKVDPPENDLGPFDYEEPV